MELDIQEPWLSHVASSRKKVEGRLRNAKYEDWVGKNIRFYNDTSSVMVRVKGIRHYDTLFDYLDVEGYKNVVPGIESYAEAVRVYHSFYSDETIRQRGGMVAIEVEVIA